MASNLPSVLLTLTLALFVTLTEVNLTSGHVYTSLSKLAESLEGVRNNQLAKRLKGAVSDGSLNSRSNDSTSSSIRNSSSNGKNTYCGEKKDDGDSNRSDGFKETVPLHIKRFLKELTALSEESLDSGFSLKHPLNAFRFIRNHSEVFHEIKQEFMADVDPQEHDIISMMIVEETKLFPSVSDLKGVVHNIINLQVRYRLTVADLAEGQIRGYTSRPLAARECLSVALHSYSSHHAYGQMWLHHAVELVKQGRRLDMTLEQVYTAAAHIANTSESYLEALQFAKDLQSTGWKADHLVQSYQDTVNRVMKTADKRKWREINDKFKRAKTFKLPQPTAADLTCQGSRTHNPNDNYGCRMTDNGHPFLRIQPIKIEEVSRAPYIIIMHGVISRPVLEHYKSEARKLLYPSEIEANEDSHQEIRSSHSCHFGLLETHSLRRRIEALTSLSLHTSEPIQVANYGVAGYYAEHVDSWSKGTNRNNRLATFMLYLTDVEAGGATSFPWIGKSIFPKAGSAIFWYNLQPDGELDMNTVHEACPVLVGDKWILTAWIDERGQAFVNPSAG